MLSHDTLLQTADDAARAAGKLLLEGARTMRDVRTKVGKDVKIEADVASERLIRKMLGEVAPYPVIGEEEGGDADLTGRYEPYWIVDPLDGTHNYLRGVPLCAVSIALFRGETPILGVIYDFNRDESFAGVVAETFQLNGQPFEPSWAQDTASASLQTGFPVGRDYSAEALQDFVGNIQRFQKIRSIGSAALALAWVAAGRFDVYFEEGIRLWDVAAGLALVQAAGGAIRMSPTPNKSLAYNVWAAGRPGFLPEG